MLTSHLSKHPTSTMKYFIDRAAATNVEEALIAFYDEKASKYQFWMNQPNYPTVALR